MIKKTISPVTTALGVLLLILSFAWPSLTDQNTIWSGEQEQERGEAIGDLHRQSHNPSSDEALEKARERVHSSNVALKQARDRHQWKITLLKWSGILLVGVGAVTLIVTRNSQN